MDIIKDCGYFWGTAMDEYGHMNIGGKLLIFPLILVFLVIGLFPVLIIGNILLYILGPIISYVLEKVMDSIKIFYK